MKNAEKLAKDTDLMATLLLLYCKSQHNCTECKLADAQCCVLTKHAGIIDFLESEAEEK